MHFRSVFFPVILGILASTIIACDDDMIIWDIESYEVIGPIMKTEASLNEVSDFGEFEHTSRVDISQIEELDPGDYDDLPEMTFEGPFKLDSLTFSEYFTQITIEEIEMTVNLDNNFPLPINSGLVLVFSETDSDEELFRTTLNDSIGENGEKEFDVKQKDLVLPGSVDVEIRNVGTLGTDEELSLTEEDHFTLELSIDAFDIKSATIRPGHIYQTDFTEAVEEIKEDEDLEDEEIRDVEGKITFYIENSLPVELEFQLTMIDNQANTQEPLFEEEGLHIKPGEVNKDNGDVQQTVESESSIPISAERWNNIRNSNQIDVFFQVSSEHLEEPNKIVAKNSKFEVQLVADLVINPQ